MSPVQSALFVLFVADQRRSARCYAQEVGLGTGCELGLMPERLAPREWGDLAACSLDPDRHVLAFARPAGAGGGA
jgi:hypothetical protein